MGCQLDSSNIGDTRKNDHTNLPEPGGGGGGGGGVVWCVVCSVCCELRAVCLCVVSLFHCFTVSLFYCFTVSLIFNACDVTTKLMPDAKTDQTTA